MSLLPLLVVAFGAAGLSLLLGRWRSASIAVGLIGLFAVLVLALLWSPTTGEIAGQEILAGGPYVRLFLILGCAAALLLALVLTCLPGGDPPSSPRAAAQPNPAADLAATATLAVDRPGSLRGQTEFAAGALLLLGSSAVALDLGSPLPALLATAAAGFAGLVALGAGRSTASQAGIGLRTLRGLGVAVALTIVSGAALLAASDPLAGRPFAVGPAYLVLAGAVALRLGAIPFHGMIVAPHVGGFPLAVPLLFVWGPIALAVVVMATLGSILPPLELPLSDERGLVVAAGVLSLILGAVAAAVQDDLDHIVAYSIVQDGGLVLLALAAFDPPAWGSARIWFLVFALAKTAFVTWALVLRRTMSTGDLGELSGWARRTPLLGIALVGIALATVGLPGLAVFDARQELVHQAMTDPFATVVVLGGLLSLVYYGRLLAIGLGAPSPLVIAAGDWFPRRTAIAQRPTVPAQTSSRSTTAGVAPATRSSTPAAGARSTLDSSGRPPEASERSESQPVSRSSSTGTANRTTPATVTPAPGRAGARPSQMRGISGRPAQPVASGSTAGSRSTSAGTSSSSGRSGTASSSDGRGTGGYDGDRGRVRRPAGSALAAWLDQIGRTWRTYGAPISASLVLAMALLAVVASSGGFGLAEAAPANQPVPFGGAGPIPTLRIIPIETPLVSAAPSPTRQPSPTKAPAGSKTPAPSKATARPTATH